jgi:hypothetical protein
MGRPRVAGDGESSNFGDRERFFFKDADELKNGISTSAAMDCGCGSLLVCTFYT